MKKISLLLLALLSLSILHAQQAVETRLLYADTTNFGFSSEWQYLSTDIYLLNGNKFSRVINDLNLSAKDAKKGKKRGLAEERLEYLYITAQLVNVKFFGDQNVVYPLYNFKINTDKDQKYHTFVSDNIESIRIIDNLPLYSANDKIDAKIDVSAISQNDKDNILSIIGAQLKNLGNLMRPSTAVLSLVGEMGSFIESNAKKKEYKFSSTIRLFEQKNFDTRLHSIRIYAMAAPGTPKLTFNSNNIDKYLDTCEMPDLERGLLEKLIAYKNYPLIVVANYKSLYRMESMNGDEVSFASIDKRKVNIENNFRDKLISEETYRQERDFIDFLTVFANFKSQLELYTLNSRMGNSEASMKSIAAIVPFYYSLQQEYERILYKYRGNKTFDNIFKSEYTSTLDFASFYLENDHNLRASKQMINTMRDLSKKGAPNKSADMENALRNLRFIDNLNDDFKTKVKEGQSIMTLIKDLENRIMQQSFNTDIAALRNTRATNDKVEPLLRLKEKVGSTNCLSCREQVMDAIKEYYSRLELIQRVDEQKKRELVLQKVAANMNTYIQNLQLVEENLPHFFDQNSMMYEMLKKKTDEVSRDMDNLKHLSSMDMSDKTADLLRSFNEKVEQTMKSVNDGFEFIKHEKAELLVQRARVQSQTVQQPISSSAEQMEQIVEEQASVSQ